MNPRLRPGRAAGERTATRPSNRFPAVWGQAVRVTNSSLSPKGFTKEITSLPLRSFETLRNIVSNQKIDLHELNRGVEVHRLVHVVRRSVVSIGDPFIRKFLGIDTGIPGFVSLEYEQGWHSLLHE